MDDRGPRDVFLDALAKVLIRSFLIGAALLAWWFFFFLAGGEWAYRIHSRWFEITPRDFDLMNYYGMALLKISILTFFLIPYLSIRLILRSNQSAG